MNKSALVLALACATALGGLPQEGPPPPPPAPPPAAPATPPPAPPPARPEVAPQVDEYGRIKAMSTDEIDRLGLARRGPLRLRQRYDIREADRPVLTKNAEVLKKFDFIRA